jgi:hypothetical protein
MTWPTTPGFSKANLDAGSDSPGLARPDIYSAMADLESVINGRGQASGVASLGSDTLVPLAQLPVTPITTGRMVDGTAGAGKTWNVPAGVTRVRVRVVGAGAGGGYSGSGDHGGGGGAGGYAEKHFTVVPGSTFTYTVGAKGVGKSSAGDGDGTDGGASSVVSPASATPGSTTVTAAGGTKGLGPPDRFGGAGGSTTNADLGVSGGAGVSGATRGGAGGGSALGGGVAGATGYGGAGGFGSGGGTSAFNGLDGVVIFEW